MNKIDCSGAFKRFANAAVRIIFALGIASTPALANAVGTTSASFTVNPSGLANYQIPITLPPGVAGVQPDLSIVYNSTDTYGLFGRGTSLSGLSAISRCPATLETDGYVQDVRFNSFDRYCLDGQKLIALSQNNGSVGAEYRTELNNFSIIESVGGSNSLPGYFRVKTKSGLIMEYGRFGESTINDGSSARTFSWLLSNVEDLNGNYYSIQYSREPATGEVLPSRILFTGNIAEDSVPPHEVIMEYETRPDRLASFVFGVRMQQTQRIRRIVARANGVISRSYTMQYDQGAGLDRTRLISVQECAGDGICLNPTTLTWAPIDPVAFQTPLLDGVTRSISGSTDGASVDIARYRYGDFNGDGRTDILIIEGYASPSTNSRIYLSTGNGFQSPINGPAFGVFGTVEGALLDIARIRLVDINSDGYTDIARIVGYDGFSPIEIYINNKNGTFANPRQGPSVYLSGTNPQARQDLDRIHFADFNGDGLIDIYYLEGRNTLAAGSIYRQNINGTFTRTEGPSVFVDHNYGRCDIDKVRVGDFNGDGAADIYVAERLFSVSEGGINYGRGRLYTSNRTGGFDFINGFLHQVTENSTFCSLKLRRFQIADFNGDGNSDFLFINGGEGALVNSTIAMSKGNGAFELVNNGPAIPIGITTEQQTVDTARVKIADLNSDGLSDLYIINGSNSTTQATIYYSRGDGQFFQTNGYPHSVSTNSQAALNDLARIDFGDFDGNGTLDIYAILGLGQTIPGRIYRLNNQPVHLVTSITNGLGARVDINYAPLTRASVYTGDTNEIYPNVDILHGGYVVETYDDAAADSSAVYRTRFQYVGLKQHIRGRGSLGFRTVSITNEATQQREITTYRQGFPFIGMPSVVNNLVRNTQTGNYVLTSNMQLQYSSLNATSTSLAATTFAFVSNITNREYEFTNNRLYRSTVTQNFYQESIAPSWGNLTTQRIYVYEGDVDQSSPHETLIANTYSTDPTMRRYGRLMLTKAVKTDPLGELLERRSSFTYHPSTYLLESETIEPDSATLRLVTTYGRDDFGNINRQVTQGATGGERVIQTNYDRWGRFPKEVINQLGHITRFEYDDATGNIEKRTDPGTVVTTSGYDSFGRLRRVDQPNGYFATIDRQACPCASGGRFQIVTSGNDGSQSSISYDAREREVGRTSRSFDGSVIGSISEYDLAGRLARQSIPRLLNSGTPVYWSSVSYDASGRVAMQVAPFTSSQPAGRVNTFSYDGLSTTQTDAAGNNDVRRVDRLGQLLSTRDALQNLTSYEYDAYGNLERLTDPDNNTTVISYDGRGQRRSITDPNLGVIRYTYNAFGEVETQTDASQQVRTFTYDKLGRLKTRTDADLMSTWTYDTRFVGRTTSVESDNGYREEYTYDSLGRPEEKTISIDGTSHIYLYVYDSIGRPLNIIYPNGFSIDYAYNTFSGFLANIKNSTNGNLIWTADEYDHFGQLSQFTQGNDVSTSRVRDQASGDLRSITSSNRGGIVRQSLNYEWNTLGSLTLRRANDLNLDETFGYDPLQRLTSITNSAVSSIRPNVTIGYDDIGNIRSRSDVGLYRYANGKPQQVSSIDPITGSTIPSTAHSSYSYDDNGNTLTGGGRTTTWTSYNLPASVTTSEGHVAFRYGPQRQRISQIITPSGLFAQTTSILYFDDYEVVRRGASTETKAYIRTPQGEITAIANRRGLILSMQYLQQDHLGSTNLVTNNNGAVAERFAYDAFGKRREMNWSIDTNNSELAAQHETTRGYTGQEHLDSVSLIHYNGRVYDPIIGRFTSGDPFVQNPTDSQGLNRYSYVQNNPLSATDPSGFFLRRLARGVRSLFRSAVVANIARVGGTALSLKCGPAFVACVAASEAFISHAQGARGANLFARSAFAAVSAYAGGSSGGFGSAASDAGQRSLGEQFFNAVVSGVVEDISTISRRIRSGSSGAADGGAGAQGFAGDASDPPGNTRGETAGATSSGINEKFASGALSFAFDFAIGFLPGYSLAAAVLDPESTGLDVLAGALELVPGVGRAAGLGVRFAARTSRAAKGEITVYRVFGGDARAQGFSYTTVDPRTVRNFRDAAGLPSGGPSGAINTADFLIEGRVNASSVIRSRSAEPLDGNRGGLPELIIDPKNVRITDFSVLNP